MMEEHFPSVERKVISIFWLVSLQNVPNLTYFSNKPCKLILRWFDLNMKQRCQNPVMTKFKPHHPPWDMACSGYDATNVLEECSSRRVYVVTINNEY